MRLRKDCFFAGLVLSLQIDTKNKYTYKQKSKTGGHSETQHTSCTLTGNPAATIGEVPSAVNSTKF